MGVQRSVTRENMTISITAIGKLDVDSDSDVEYIWEITNTSGSDFTYTWQSVGGEAGEITLLANTTTQLFTNTLDDVSLLDGNTTIVTGNYVNQNASSTYFLSNGADDFVGHNGKDNIDGGNGNDTIDGGVGADTIEGGAGDDYIKGGDTTYSAPAGAPAIIAPSDPNNVVMNGNNVQSVIDTSGNGNTAFQNNAAHQPGLSQINGFDVLDFDGVDEHLHISNSSDINDTAHDARSIFISFTTSDEITARQYIYEEGAQVNGFSFYIYDGDLYVAGWKSYGNHFEHYHSTSIDTFTTYTVGFVFDSDNDSFTAYLDGAIIDTGSLNGYEQARHTGNVTIGANGGRTRNELGQDNSAGEYFKGQIGDFALYNEALDAAGVAQITGTLAQTWGNGDFSENDSLSGGAGDDTIEGGVGSDTIRGGDDNDSLDGGDGGDDIYGDDGDDVLFGRDDDDDLRGGDGNDTLHGGNNEDTLAGGNGDDQLNGGNGDDELFGQGNDDTLNGGNGDDTIDGGSGADLIDGGIDDDTIDGEGGEDTINGGNGDDSIDGGTGNDTIDGGNDSDTINGGADDDWIDGQEGDDTVEGGAGNDIVEGGNGADVLRGGDGDDIIVDIYTHATAFDTGVNDQLFGEGGNDSLVSTSGQDTLTGGSGDDIFSFTAFDSVIDAEITDFVQGEDLIHFIDIINGSHEINHDYEFDFASLNISQSGGNTHLTFASGTDIQITGFTGTLTAADFDF